MRAYKPDNALNKDKFKNPADAFIAFCKHVEMTNPDQDPEEGYVYDERSAIYWMYDYARNNGVLNP